MTDQDEVALFEDICRNPKDYKWVSPDAGAINEEQLRPVVFKGETHSAAYWMFSMNKSLNDFQKAIIEPMQTASIAMSILGGSFKDAMTAENKRWSDEIKRRLKRLQ